MLSLRSCAFALLCLTACGDGQRSNDGGTVADRSIAIRGEVCGWLCDDRSSNNRAPGDFTGIGCASEARIRLYPPGAALVGAAPLVETCVSLTGTTSLADLFQVTAGLSGASPATGNPVTLPSLSTLGSAIAEVALYAPGGPACPADAPLVALGRSAVTDLAQASAISVPLGCHASCATSVQRQLQLRVEAIDTRVDESASFDELTIGDMYSYEELVRSEGRCASSGGMPGDGAISFRPYASTRGPSGYAVRYGIDASAHPGCVALRGRRGGFTSYACLDGPETASPLAVFVPAAQLAAVASLRGASGNTPTHGTLLIQTIDASGAAVNATTVTVTDGGTSFAVGSNWDLSSSFGHFTSFQGMTVVPDAAPGVYSAGVPGRPNATFYFGGAEPGTITTVRVRLP